MPFSARLSQELLPHALARQHDVSEVEHFFSTDEQIDGVTAEQIG